MIGTDGHHYSHFKGKQQAGIKCHQSGMQKLTFLGEFWSKKQPVFWHNTQCNDSRDTIYTWWEGKGFPDIIAVLEGGVMVMKKINVESYANLNSTELARSTSGQLNMVQIQVENHVEQTF